MTQESLEYLEYLELNLRLVILSFPNDLLWFSISSKT